MGLVARPENLFDDISITYTLNLSQYNNPRLRVFSWQIKPKTVSYHQSLSIWPSLGCLSYENKFGTQLGYKGCVSDCVSTVLLDLVSAQLPRLGKPNHCRVTWSIWARSAMCSDLYILRPTYQIDNSIRVLKYCKYSILSSLLPADTVRTSNSSCIILQISTNELRIL